MALVHDRCICLRKVEYSETSQILVLFSRDHGVQQLMAKGAHRRTKAGSSKFDGGIDLLEIGDAVFTQKSDRELGLLTEWSLRDGHLALRRNLRAMYLGLYAAELVALLIEAHDPHPTLFDRLEACLADLETSRAEEVFLTFELDLLRESGYLPELGTCGGCGREIEMNGTGYFSPSLGSVICRNCESGYPGRISLDARLLSLLRTILRLPRTNGETQRLPKLTRHQTDPLNKLFADHVEHTLGRRMRMRGYVL